MYCKYCGTDNASDSKFCSSCGANLEENNAQGANEQPNYSQPDYSQPDYSQPNSSQNPYANYNPAYQNNGQNGKGFAIAGLVCGIISLFCFAFILGTLGIIFGCVAKSKGYKGGMATAGIVCGIIGIVLWAVMLIF